jgi:acyl-CoA dehydrogenase
MNVERQLDASANRSAALAPDTRGWNFYDADIGLKDLLSVYLAPALLEHLTPWLTKLGSMAANELDVAAHLADKHTPILHHRDRFGRDQQWIEYHPAYRDLEEAAYGTFGIHAMSHRAGIMDWPEPYPATAKHAFTYLFNQAEFGLGCPINVTDSGMHAILKFASPEIKDWLIPKMSTTDTGELWQGGQYMTEKEGGSDVGSLTTVARLEDGQWRVYGEKWFCSNADAELNLMLARPEGASEGTRGLALFALPRSLEDGSPNHYRIVRLKEKLGTRSMASGEVILEGAVVHPIGPLDRGIHQMLEMVNWSRLSNGIKSSALMRRAVHDSTAVMRGRKVFGQSLMDKPLARRQMLKIQLPAEQSLSLWFFTADVLDKAEGYGGQPASQEAAALLRIATPVLKFRSTRDGRRVTGDAMEMRGGIGYVEEFVNPRLLRDAHLGSIWEGTSNIVALDAVTRAVAKHDCHVPFQAALHARLDEAEGLPDAYRAELKGYIDRAVEGIGAVGASKADEAQCRQVTSAFYHAATAALMAWEGTVIHAKRGDARRLLWSKLVVEHRLKPRDPFQLTDTALEDEISALLLGDAAVPLADAARLVLSER